MIEGLKHESKIADDEIDIPINHPTYKDIVRRIEDYTDKYYLAELFAEDEGDTNDELSAKLDNYQKLHKLAIEDKFLTRMNIRWSQHQTEIDRGANKDEALEVFFDREIYEINDKLTPEMVELLNRNPNVRLKHLEHKINELNNKVNNRFSDFIRHMKDYPKDPNNRVVLELPGQAHDIIDARNEIRNNFQKMRKSTNKEPIKLTINYNNSEKSKELETCKKLEELYGLRKNPKNGQYYISNGEGMYIPFNTDHLIETYARLRDLFYFEKSVKVPKEDGGGKKTVNEFLIFSRNQFYDLADKYSVVQSEAEKDIIAFPNCCYDSKTKTVYDLDYRLPRLPMRTCKVSFIWDHIITDGGALQQIFNYCFDEKERTTIFQYFGKALFEKGYTESQDSLYIMGMGNVGKSTFINALTQIFDKISVVSAATLKPDNQFAFGELPGSDFIILDEVTGAQNGFMDMIKFWTGGLDNLTCNKKYTSTIKLDAEYIPRFIGTGNQLPKCIYDEKSGKGVLRRVNIVFLKRSILDAKLDTREVLINGKKQEIPVYVGSKKEVFFIRPTEDHPITIEEFGETTGVIHRYQNGKFIPVMENDKPCIRTQSRTYFNQNDLVTDQTLQWFLQQVILNYEPGDKRDFDEKDADERFEKAYCPEAWALPQIVRKCYDGEGNLDTENEFVYAEELLERVHNLTDSLMLERTWSDVELDGFEKEVLKKAMKEYVPMEYIDGKKIYRGLAFIE